MQDPSSFSWSVSALLDATNQILDICFPTEVWLCGVLSGYKEHASRHRYFRLVEYGSDKKSVIASIDAVAFYRDRQQIGRTLKGFPGVEFHDNVPVRLLVKPTLYKTTGRFQVIVRDIDPYYTSAVLIQRREEVVQRMREEGIAEKNLTLPLPKLPLRIALLTSQSGEAKHDFLHELQRLRANFQVTQFDIRVQGEEVEKTMLLALTAISATPEAFDLVVIIRGGGSVQDLSYFNNEAIARAVCCCPVKVVVGIGHERDQTSLDSLAYSVKTPTAAAGLILTLVQEQLDYLHRTSERLGRLLSQAVARQRYLMLHMITRVQQGVSRRFERHKGRLHRHPESLALAAFSTLSAESRHLDSQQERLIRAINQQLSAQREALARQELILKYTKKRLNQPQFQITQPVLDFETRNPILSIDDAHPRQKIIIPLADGDIVATIDDIVPQPHNEP